MKIWKDIKGFEGHYKISDNGVVISYSRIIIRKDGIPHTFEGKIKSQHITSKGYYAVNLSKNGKHHPYSIHRLLGETFLDVKKGFDIDHKDGDKKNNSLDNLRIATKSQNKQNQKKQKGKYFSTYKGVSFFRGDGRKKKWTAHISKDYKIYLLGYYLTEVEAAKVYNEKAKELFGEFASLNEI